MWRAVLPFVLLTHCASAVTTADGAVVAADAPEEAPPSEPVESVDLLFVINNEIGYLDQARMAAELDPLAEALLAPSDGARPVRDLRVGVISTDLGTPGAGVPSCANSAYGDDGRLNPIRYGGAMARHQPWTLAPPSFGRPADCADPNEFPSFLSFSSGDFDGAAFDHDVRCNAMLYNNGCGLPQPLEAIHRALVLHDARARPGNVGPNAGFLRDNALLVIVVLSKLEDHSARDCRYADGFDPCRDATDVYQPGSTVWADDSLTLRFYMYQPCGQDDPTWPLDRYVDPRRPERGLLGLKPGHPERIVFAAITGVPIFVPSRTIDAETRTDWDALLGTPSAGRPDDYCARDASSALAVTSAEGPISMRQADLDPMCPWRVLPGCRMEGTTVPDPSLPEACNSAGQYFGWPARRIAEVARRFDESPLCDGAPCRNGFVASMCSASYAGATASLVEHIRRRLTP